MPRAVGICDISIIPGTLVCIFYHQGDGSAGSFPLEDSGKDFYEIALFTGRGITALAGFSSVKKNLDIFLAERKACRTSVHNSSKCLAVGFPPGGDCKFISK